MACGFGGGTGGHQQWKGTGGPVLLDMRIVNSEIFGWKSQASMSIWYVQLGESRADRWLFSLFRLGRSLQEDDDML